MKMKVNAGSRSRMPALAFPCEEVPELFKPENSVLELTDGSRISIFKLCYLVRPTDGRSNGDYTEKSALRIAALPGVLLKLSNFFRVKGLKSPTQANYLRFLQNFFDWADLAENEGRFEAVLTDTGLAVAAIEGYNAWQKAMVQVGKLGLNTASAHVKALRTMLSELHEQDYAEETEVLAASNRTKKPTVPAESSDVQHFLSAVAGAFDLCAEIVLKPGYAEEKEWEVVATNGATEQKYLFRRDADGMVALDLACMCFAALAIGDSGTNEAQITRMDYSDEIYEQLADANIVTMRRKEVKFRAGGKEVPVHFTAVVRTRFHTYLALRTRILELFPNDDLEAALFLRLVVAQKTEFASFNAIGCKRVTDLLDTLRGRFNTWFGLPLPKVTLRQLRLHTGNKFTEIAGPKVSAERLGHSLRTAIRNYNNGPQSTRNSELGDFFGSVAKSAVEAARTGDEQVPPDTELVTGACKERGKPQLLTAAPVTVEPDCRKTEGCLFCAQYRVHADEKDMRKLISCNYVMKRLALRSGSANDVEMIYQAIMARVHTLLAELSQRSPDVFEAVKKDVQVNQNLSPYWAARFRQLCLLGVITAPVDSQEGAGA
ncbi:hypothetical protein J8I26_02140 [Herbaspirillum sp. LeCh32-8]|uniref:hypothetical protein n=1 Tax=Herbaspirillum sp. LeCh32-8 TaxID=2821356 RepID=UPI001AE644EB|nr:hypothetical protein [Herbaspirillum sp. LeCh32-8]MBP0596884.1 hypothetical protein [Herbaspirillum sp. LeCh32-8]